MGQIKNLMIEVDQRIDNSVNHSDGMGIHSTRLFGMMDGLTLALDIVREARLAAGEEATKTLEADLIWHAVKRIQREHWAPSLVPANGPGGLD